MPSPRRTARQADLLERLVALLTAQGFSDLTLDDLAERLRCSKTTLYQLARSKQGLVVEAVKHYFRGPRRRWRSGSPRPPTRPTGCAPT